MADEIEHIQPKNFFPNLTFSWDNFLYACGPCNGPKGNKVAVFHPNSTNYSELEHPENGYLPSQPIGNPLLINPRIEDPLDYLWLDISGTFSFVPIDDNVESLSSIRSRYTIKVLRLNIRDDLRDARRNAYGMYKARLSEYVTQKQNSQPQIQLNRLINGIIKEQHPTVWMEIKRQHRQFPALLELFQVAPEALSW